MQNILWLCFDPNFEFITSVYGGLKVIWPISLSPPSQSLSRTGRKAALDIAFIA